MIYIKNWDGEMVAIDRVAVSTTLKWFASGDKRPVYRLQTIFDLLMAGF